MDEQNLQQEIDPEVINLAGFKSRQLAGNYGFARFEAEDIQQDLLLAYLQRSRSFDSQRSSVRSFARFIVNNAVATLIEARRAAYRGYQTHRLSLNERSDRQDPNSPELVETVIDPDSRALETKLNRALDIDRLLTRLPVPLANICRAIMLCDTCAEAAMQVGVSRATFYRQVCKVRRGFSPRME